LRIVIQNSGATEFVLCAGITESEFVEGWDEQAQELVQESAFLRAVRSRFFPRGNTSTTVQFSITKEHADAITCAEYLAFRHRNIPKSGTVVLIAEETAGNQSRITLTDAVLRSTGRTYIGLTSFLRYAMAGGDFTEAST
jgi:hypothetical protein